MIRVLRNAQMRIQRLQHQIEYIWFLITGTLLLNSGRVLYFFYTDQHNVDEDLTAIVNYGGGWAHTTYAGVTCRSMDNPPDLLDLVASICSFKCGCVYITTLIVNELIGDNSVKESIVH